MIALIRHASCVILALLLGAGAAGAQERGYIVAAINHYRANTYDANIAYAPGVDRAAIHRLIGEAAKEFFDASLTRSDRR
jgi:hypothetical protein